MKRRQALMWIPGMGLLSRWLAQPVEGGDYQSVFPKKVASLQCIRWIPVAERLPTIGQIVLIHHRSHVVPAERSRCGTGWCLPFLTTTGHIFKELHITHWAELPKGPVPS